MLNTTAVVNMSVGETTNDHVERLKFRGSPANTNCALRTLRQMLHKAEEWKLIARAPKVQLMKEHGRSLRLDDEAERNCSLRLMRASGENARGASFVTSLSRCAIPSCEINANSTECGLKIWTGRTG